MSEQHVRLSNSKIKKILHNCVRYAYTLIVCFLLPLIIFAYRKKLKGDAELKNRSFLERFGMLPSHLQPGGIVLHCVSVGEVNAATGLVKALQQSYPSLLITITTSSTTGASHALKLFGKSVQHCYLPFDIPLFISLFVSRLKPQLVMITEVEVWPNLMSKCFNRNIPLVLVNARMTCKSLKNYKKLKWLFRPTFRQFSRICPQSSESFNNFVEFGVFKKQLVMTNNMKFDLELDTSDIEQGSLLQQELKIDNRPILLAASTHEPEEKMLLDVYLQLKTKIDDLLLIIVPRHPQRFESVHQIIKATGVELTKVSTLNQKAVFDNKLECVLVDTMGKLKACYSICNVAFVGGSFATKGGHNALEAALFAKPVIMGPSVYNNPGICNELKNQKALHIAMSKQEVLEIAQKWLSDKSLAQRLGANGKEVIANNSGAISKTMKVLAPMLSSSGSGSSDQ